MKLWIFSDLHQDFGRFDLEPPAEADVAIAAGDIQNDGFLVNLAKRMPVVMVAGNHEFYGRMHSERLAELEALPGVYFLENDTVTIDLAGHAPVRIVGATLWTDYGRDPLAAETARRGMNDHRLIKWSKDPYQRFLPSHATALHNESRAAIVDASYTTEGVRLVVVTHHAPSEKSVHPKYAGQIMNRAYYSDMDDLVANSGAALWVHGHVHSSFDYQIKKTRVVCNPHGYPGENPEFNPALVIEI